MGSLVTTDPAATLFEHFFGSLPREEKAKPKSTAKTPRVGATRK